MKSDREVANEVRRRMDNLRAKNARRKNRLYTASAIAASLALVVGLAITLPGIVPETVSETPGLQGATLLAGGGAGGYVLIGVVGFVLGAAVTLLCLRLFKKKR